MSSRRDEVLELLRQSKKQWSEFENFTGGVLLGKVSELAVLVHDTQPESELGISLLRNGMMAMTDNFYYFVV